MATAGVAVLLAMVLNSLVTNPRWEWGVVGAHLTEESIVRGLWTTIQLTLVTAVLGFALGTVLALMRLSRSPLIAATALQHALDDGSYAETLARWGLSDEAVDAPVVDPDVAG